MPSKPRRYHQLTMNWMCILSCVGSKINSHSFPMVGINSSTLFRKGLYTHKDFQSFFSGLSEHPLLLKELSLDSTRPIDHLLRGVHHPGVFVKTAVSRKAPSASWLERFFGIYGCTKRALYLAPSRHRKWVIVVISGSPSRGLVGVRILRGDDHNKLVIVI